MDIFIKFNINEEAVSMKVINKRQRIDMAILEQDMEKEQVKVSWVKAGDILTNPLTKKNTGAEQLLKMLETEQLEKK